jgi:hypothetical protein
MRTLLTGRLPISRLSRFLALKPRAWPRFTPLHRRRRRDPRCGAIGASSLWVEIGSDPIDGPDLTTSYHVNALSVRWDAPAVWSVQITNRGSAAGASCEVSLVAVAPIADPHLKNFDVDIVIGGVIGSEVRVPLNVVNANPRLLTYAAYGPFQQAAGVFGDSVLMNAIASEWGIGIAGLVVLDPNDGYILYEDDCLGFDFDSYCQFNSRVLATQVGRYSFEVAIIGDQGIVVGEASLDVTSVDNYAMARANGEVLMYGEQEGTIDLKVPDDEEVAGVSYTADGDGYWLVAADDGIFTFGDAPYLGSAGAFGFDDLDDLRGFFLPADDGWIDIASLGVEAQGLVEGSIGVV